MGFRKLACYKETLKENVYKYEVENCPVLPG